MPTFSVSSPPSRQPPAGREPLNDEAVLSEAHSPGGGKAVKCMRDSAGEVSDPTGHSCTRHGPHVDPGHVDLTGTQISGEGPEAGSLGASLPGAQAEPAFPMVTG